MASSAQLVYSLVCDDVRVEIGKQTVADGNF